MAKYPKRLIEVDLPIKRISAHARREKSIRHGHISTLHIWWARRPLAACRAVICAALWPDPADPDCPKSFITVAQKLMREWSTHERQSLLSAESRPHFETLRQSPTRPISPIQLRAQLLDFIADFANWDNSTVREYLDTSRALTQAAHEALGGAPGTRPLVVDPFCGGGSIPLEALRVGADAFASDLNPIPVLLNKVVLEYIPKYGQRLADEVRKWGEWIKREAEKELAGFYPCLPAGRPKTPESATPGKFYAYVLRCSDGSLYKGQTDNLVRRFKQHCDGEVEWTKAHLPVDLIHFDEFDTREESVEREKWLKSGVGREWLATKFPKETPIAYLWARIIQCEGPGCGAEVPLIRSLWLAKKANRSVALQLVPRPRAKRVDFQIIVKQTRLPAGRQGGWVDQDDPKTKIEDPKFDGTVKRGSATCACCGYTTPIAHVREQLKERRGGAAGARLYCIASTRDTEQGRFYRLPNDADHEAVAAAKTRLARRKSAYDGPASFVPNESTVEYHSFVNRGPIYGMVSWEDYFYPRQALALGTLATLIRKAGQKLQEAEAGDFSVAVQTCLALSFGRILDLANSLCGWTLDTQCVKNLFRRQAIPMVWNFAEGVCIGDSAGSWSVVIERFPDILASLCSHRSTGTVQQADAAAHPLPNDAAQAIVTDPPYYYSVQYADLSDFFYVWMRRTLGGRHPGLLDLALTPKDAEIIVQSPGHEFAAEGKNNAFYESRMTLAMAEARRVLEPSGIAVVVFAHTSTKGWEAQLQSMIAAGWVVTGSWPIDTEMASRVIAQGRAVLASSVHIVCRPRENPDGSIRLPAGRHGTDEVGLPAGASAAVGDWRDVLAELPRRIHDWMPRLAEEGVVGADAIFACLGPALEVFSRYSRVEKASGEAVPLKEYLEHVWAAVAKEALTMIFTGADTAAFEEDARLTAMWLWTLKTGEDGSPDPSDSSHASDSSDEDDASAAKKGGGGAVPAGRQGFVLEFDAARKIAQGLGAHLEDLASLVAVEGETARLLPVAERARTLFGKDEGKAATTRRKREPQMDLFKALPADADTPASFGLPAGQAGDTKFESLGHTVLDRVHQSMILSAAGCSEALKRFLVEDAAGNDARFWTLAQALSALCPASTDEKRWVDGVLARKKGLGF